MHVFAVCTNVDKNGVLRRFFIAAPCCEKHPPQRHWHPIADAHYRIKISLQINTAAK
jgi:hypothetical protein